MGRLDQDALDTPVSGISTESGVTVTEGNTLTYGRDHGDSVGESVAIGVGARTNNAYFDSFDGAQKVAVGYEALRGGVSYASTAVGYRAGAEPNADLVGIAALGHKAAEKNKGSYVTAIGMSAAADNTKGRVTAVGFQAGYKNTGNNITSLGFYAARDNTAEDVTAIGYTAGKDNTGNESVFVGRESGRNNTGNNTVAVGYKTATGGDLDDPSTMGNRNVGIGYEAIENNQASGVIAIGFRAGKNVQTNDQLIITQRDGTRRMVMDLTTGDLQITGTLEENATL